MMKRQATRCGAMICSGCSVEYDSRQALAVSFQPKKYPESFAACLPWWSQELMTPLKRLWIWSRSDSRFKPVPLQTSHHISKIFTWLSARGHRSGLSWLSQPNSCPSHDSRGLGSNMKKKGDAWTTTKILPSPTPDSLKKTEKTRNSKGAHMSSLAIDPRTTNERKKYHRQGRF